MGMLYSCDTTRGKKKEQNLPVLNSHTENCGKKKKELFHQERAGEQGTILCR